MSSCSCIYCDVSDGGYALDRFVEAIEERKCGECNRVINKLDKYNYIIWWEYDYCEDCDDFISECSCVEPDSTHYVCNDCQSIINLFYCDGFYFGRVIERLQDHVSDVGDRVLSCDMRALTKRARDIVCDLVEEYWEDTAEEE